MLIRCSARLVRVGVAATMALALLVGVEVPVHATTEGSPPAVLQLHPVPGEVVDGRLQLRAVLSTSAPVASASLVVDQVERDVRVRSDGQGSVTVIADVDLAEGPHLARVELTDDRGRLVRRSWRFATVDLEVRRLAGSDRVATAAALSRASFPRAGSATAAVIATAGAFPDGLAAAPLAAHVGGPLLLSAPDLLSDATAAELTRAVEPGGTVVLLGGPAALSEDVAQAVVDLGFEVDRIAGPRREDTAAAIARRLPPATTAFVATSHAFADGLAAAAPAARDGSPILLTEPHGLSAATRAFLADRVPDRVVIVGGPAAVSAGVEREIAALVPSVERIHGRDRYATAAALVDAFHPEGAASGVALASGVDFPDGLAGGLHAARQGVPLFLSPPDDVPPVALERIVAGDPAEVLLYGGTRALATTVEGQLRTAILDRVDGPTIVARTPAPGSTVHRLDTVELMVDRGVDPNRSTIHVTVDGQEVRGVVSQGDFDDHLVLTLGEWPFVPTPDVDVRVVVHAQVLDGTQWGHGRWSFTYRKLALGQGDTGAEVEAIQRRLTDLGYWLGEPDGRFGPLTSQALMAFQKYEGLPRTGVADAATISRLEVAVRPVPAANAQGRWVEIDKTRQVMLFVRDGAVQWAMNTSTGTETEYTRPDGTKGFAHTPEGWFTFFRQIDGLREAELGQMWRPKYFTNAGHAIHGSRSIPAHPASHGCARLSYPAIDFVWEAGLAPIGTRLYVHT